MKTNKTLSYLFLAFFGCQTYSFASGFEIEDKNTILHESQSSTSIIPSQKVEPFSLFGNEIKEWLEKSIPSPIFTEARVVKTESDLKSLANSIVMHNELTAIDFGILGKKAFELDSSFTMQRLHSFKANNQKIGDNSAMFAKIEWILLGQAVCYGKESFLEDIFSSFGSLFMASFNIDENEMLIKHFNPYFLSVKYKQKGILNKLFRFRSDAPGKMKPMEYNGWFCDLIFYSISQKNLDAFSFLISIVNKPSETKDLFVSFEEMIELSWTIAAENFFGSGMVVESFKNQLINSCNEGQERVKGKSDNDPEYIQQAALKEDFYKIEKILREKN